MLHPREEIATENKASTLNKQELQFSLCRGQFLPPFLSACPHPHWYLRTAGSQFASADQTQPEPTPCPVGSTLECTRNVERIKPLCRSHWVFTPRIQTVHWRTKLMETNHGQAMKSLLTFKFKIWCLVTLRFSTAFLLTQMKTSYFPFSTIIINKVHER